MSAALGVSVRYIRRLVTERRIPFVKLGYFIRFDPAAIASWVESQRVTPDAGPGHTRRP